MITPIPIIIDSEPEKCPNCKNIKNTVEICKNCKYEYGDKENEPPWYFVITMTILIFAGLFLVISIISGWLVDEKPLFTVLKSHVEWFKSIRIR